MENLVRFLRSLLGNPATSADMTALRAVLVENVNELRKIISDPNTYLQQELAAAKTKSDLDLAAQKAHYEEQLSAVRQERDSSTALVAGLRKSLAKYDGWEAATAIAQLSEGEQPLPEDPYARIQQKMIRHLPIAFIELTGVSPDTSVQLVEEIRRNGYARFGKCQQYRYRKPATRKVKS